MSLFDRARMVFERSVCQAGGFMVSNFRFVQFCRRFRLLGHLQTADLDCLFARFGRDGGAAFTADGAKIKRFGGAGGGAMLELPEFLDMLCAFALRLRPKASLYHAVRELLTKDIAG